MKVNLKYIVLCVLLLPLFCACSSDSGDIVAAGGDPVLVTFSLDVQSSSTRADDHTWGDNTDDNADNNYPEIIGNSLEDIIDLSSLLVMAYHSDFSFAAELPIIASNDNNGHVTFTCVLPKSMPYVANKECRIMVIANCTNENYGLSYENNEPKYYLWKVVTEENKRGVHTVDAGKSELKLYHRYKKDIIQVSLD